MPYIHSLRCGAHPWCFPHQCVKGLHTQTVVKNERGRLKTTQWVKCLTIPRAWGSPVGKVQEDLNSVPWAGKVVQWVKCWSHEREDLNLISKAREEALLLKCLPQGKEDPCSTPGTHIKSQVWYPVPVIPELGRLRQKDPWSSLTGS